MNGAAVETHKRVHRQRSENAQNHGESNVNFLPRCRNPLRQHKSVSEKVVNERKSKFGIEIHHKHFHLNQMPRKFLEKL